MVCAAYHGTQDVQKARNKIMKKKMCIRDRNKLVMIGNAKYLFFRNTTLVLGAFVVLAVLWQGIRGERTTKRTWKKTDVFMLLYLVSAIFSYGISPCREDVLLGA